MPQILPTLQTIQEPSGEANKNWKSMRRLYELLAKLVNGRVSFGNNVNLSSNVPANRKNSDNINGVWLFVTTPATANTDFLITHNLGYPMSGYIVMSKGASVDVYSSFTSPPNANINAYLRATVASTAVELFVI